MALSLLDVVGGFFSRGLARRRLDVWLVYLSRYLFCKTVSVDVRFALHDTLAALRPQLVLPDSYEQACAAVARLETVMADDQAQGEALAHELLHEAAGAGATSGEEEGEEGEEPYPEPSPLPSSCPVCAHPACGCDLSGQGWCTFEAHCLDTCDHYGIPCTDQPPPPVPSPPPPPPPVKRTQISSSSPLSATFARAASAAASSISDAMKRQPSSALPSSG
mmetsp:Transcript_14659/g.43575  ORF Transcript_14659/g.43575 Transcript_14659/m.43575 type:complete len:220 (-) Transcript_14659:191-850(-)